VIVIGVSFMYGLGGLFWGRVEGWDIEGGKKPAKIYRKTTHSVVVPQKPNSEQQTFNGHVAFALAAYFPHAKTRKY